MPFSVFQYRRFWRRGDWQAAVLTVLFLWGLCPPAALARARAPFLAYSEFFLFYDAATSEIYTA
jgi:hypothetical protein